MIRAINYETVSTFGKVMQTLQRELLASFFSDTVYIVVVFLFFLSLASNFIQSVFVTNKRSTHCQNMRKNCLCKTKKRLPKTIILLLFLFCFALPT